jgi:hypothetical protein
MLKNPTYIGQKKYKSITIPSPKIIDEDTFNIVQEMLKEKMKFKRAPYTNVGKRVNFFLLKGLIRCSVCGRSYYGHKRVDLRDKAYKCLSQRYKNEYCGNRGIDIDYLDNLIWNSLLDLDKWRILEEVIIQNLKKNHKALGIASITPSASEVSIHDFSILMDGEQIPIFVNVKSAVSGGKTQKDDISKGEGLRLFYEEDVNRHFFVATFFIKFNADMSIEIEKCVVFPIAWIPDVYINPSNNGNLQSSKYKDLAEAVKRTPQDFYEVFKIAHAVAIKKKEKKINQ